MSYSITNLGNTVLHISYVQEYVHLHSSYSLYENLHIFNSNSPLQHTQSLVTIILLSVSMRLAILDSSYKWNHAVLVP